MNKEEKELQAKQEQNESLADSKKIDLYINNNGEEEQGISIMNVFSTLGKRFHIYVFVMIVGLLAGLLVPTLMYTFKDKSESAVAVILGGELYQLLHIVRAAVLVDIRAVGVGSDGEYLSTH